MPFKSKAQERFLFATHPGVAKKFSSYGVNKNLPDHVSNAPRMPQMQPFNVSTPAKPSANFLGDYLDKKKKF